MHPRNSRCFPQGGLNRTAPGSPRLFMQSTQDMDPLPPPVLPPDPLTLALEPVLAGPRLTLFSRGSLASAGDTPPPLYPVTVQCPCRAGLPPRRHPEGWRCAGRGYHRQPSCGAGLGGASPSVSSGTMRLWVCRVKTVIQDLPQRRFRGLDLLLILPHPVLLGLSFPTCKAGLVHEEPQAPASSRAGPHPLNSPSPTEEVWRPRVWPKEG